MESEIIQAQAKLQTVRKSGLCDDVYRNNECFQDVKGMSEAQTKLQMVRKCSALCDDIYRNNECFQDMKGVSESQLVRRLVCYESDDFLS